MTDKPPDNLTVAPATTPGALSSAPGGGCDPVASEAGAAATELSQEQREKLKDRILEAVQNIYDPEIPVNIFELGLIYDVQVEMSGDVKVKMTLTSPACPSAQELPVSVRSAVSRIPEAREVDVEIVWDPPWNPQMMTEVAKVTLGMM
ncbi:MAG: DUF59 domain-containing protein [Phycisphaeraceae bacterium]|nr:DUF59 domain-containing protein [Phycisphaeraceae bacterium]